jgi:hypothetical protein
LGVIGDAEAALQARRVACSRRMARPSEEGVDRDLLAAAWQQLRQSFLHSAAALRVKVIASRTRRHAVGHEMDDAVCEGARLAGTRTGDDEERAMHRGRRSALVWIETCKSDGRRALSDRRRIGDENRFARSLNLGVRLRFDN